MHPCGLHLICGKKGGGKSMIALRISAKVIAESNRKLITNIPIKKAEYAAYIHDRWPNFDPATIDDRVWIITDPKELKKFWLTYGHNWWIPDVTKEDYNKGKTPDYREAYRWLPTTASVKHRRHIKDMTPEEIQSLLYEDPPQIEAKPVEDLPPPQFAIDELQNVFPARSFQTTGHTCLFWLSQQRKLSADFIGIAQCEDHIDKEFRDLTDDRLYITNWGRKQKSFFRLPKVMTWTKWDQKPGPGVAPAVSGHFRIDVKGIGQCYDTSAGVGIEGGLSADTKETTPGIHWGWFIAAIVVALYLLFQSPKMITHFFVGLFTKPAAAQSAVPSPAPQPPNRQAPPVQNSPPPSMPGQVANARLKPNGNVNEPPPMHVTGIVAWKGVTTAYLSDGSTVSSVDPRWGGKTLDANGRINGCLIDGRRLTVGAPRGLEGGALERSDGRWLSSGDRR